MAQPWGTLSPMKTITDSFAQAKKQYDAGNPSLVACFDVVRACLLKLEAEATLGRFGDFKGKPSIEYWVARSGVNLSRPFRPELFDATLAAFDAASTQFISDVQSTEFNKARVDRVIYTAATAFCLCFDIWKPKSRKTPGTFFEVLIGSACRVRYPQYGLGKHVVIATDGDVDTAVIDLDEDDALEGATDEEIVEALQGNSVSTDLVIHNDERKKGAIIPLKITTRERIVQPFAHQRILDSAYPDKFRSFLACVSEVQRDDNTQSVKQICVPGTVALFQKHLAKLSGLYYCDIPQRYARPDLQAVIPVKRFSDLFADVDAWLNS